MVPPPGPGLTELELDEEGRPSRPLRILDLDALSPDQVGEATEAATLGTPALVGVTRVRPTESTDPLLEALTCTLVAVPNLTDRDLPRTCVTVPDLDRAVAALRATAEASPCATLTLVGLLRLTAEARVADGLLAESLAYSMLLAGPEFLAWRERTPRRAIPPAAEPVRLFRVGDTLHVVLNRPDRHNAFDRGIRDGIVEAMGLCELDDSISAVELSGAGPSFSSGGDLDEFGTTPHVAAAHLIRLRQSAGYSVHRVADRVRAVVHGSCIGAGIEVPAFAGRLDASDDARFQLPELRMGLVPGAGGTVSITRRVGRWRTAYLALRAEPVDVTTAIAWGLVDSRV
ncbi:enoyl-CoA hydratase/isomerase family protein [Asanoa iriomotensis]|uniref:Enoyl-CoA hydratase n=1 Tax=Asanoa iriomotensis TaxID=234613 RepID=A0ABQ4C3X5_9ACTN|nr:enoyl-CoA hydratase/isomerase family protein [Asanoa iriomotensis]GIF57469.1 enoyl-CoA hydratase [Asanoa iriomotensis]